MSKKIYNLISTENYMDAKILGGNPSGIINFERTPHKWAKSIWDVMRANTWHPGQINISADKINYLKLSEADKRMYDLVLAQLITNDSIQTNQLMDSINKHVTSPVVNACLARQAYEEANHSECYSVMAEDICGDTDRIFNMHEHDPELARKNNSVAEMYKIINSDENPSNEEILVAFGANQILEELVFPGGFAAIFSISHIMTGSGAMIAEIEKDESGTHVPLFKNMFRSAVKETFNSVVPTDVQDKITKMIIIMADAEKRWTKYATKNVLGFSEKAINLMVENKANSVCSNLGIPSIYLEQDGGPLITMLKKYSIVSSKSKDNFFETNVSSYSKGTLKLGF